MHDDRFVCTPTSRYNPPFPPPSSRTAVSHVRDRCQAPSTTSHLLVLLRVIVARNVHVRLLELLHERLELGILGLADNLGLAGERPS